MANNVRLTDAIRATWLWDDGRRLKWWIDLCLMAADQERRRMWRGAVVTVREGELIAGVDYLAGRWDVDRRTARRFLQALEADGMIERESRGGVPRIRIIGAEGGEEAPTERGDYFDELLKEYPDEEGRIEAFKKNCRKKRKWHRSFQDARMHYERWKAASRRREAEIVAQSIAPRADATASRRRPSEAAESGAPDDYTGGF